MKTLPLLFLGLLFVLTSCAMMSSKPKRTVKRGGFYKSAEESLREDPWRRRWAENPQP